METTLCVGLARLGQPTQQIVAGTLQELQTVDFGEPLHSLIVCGELHELELEVLKAKGPIILGIVRYLPL